MASFRLFPRLPFELRSRVWELTVEPRTVEVRYETGSQEQLLHATSSTPVPATLQTCSEARHHLSRKAYQRSFTAGTEPRYVWVNFALDMISIGGPLFHLFESERLLIRRLTFSGKSDEWFYHFRSHDLAEFKNVEEIHVVCEEGLLDWLDSWEDAPWPCPRENIRFIHRETGQVVVGEDLERMWEEENPEESTSE